MPLGPREKNQSKQSCWIQVLKNLIANDIWSSIGALSLQPGSCSPGSQAPDFFSDPSLGILRIKSGPFCKLSKCSVAEQSLFPSLNAIEWYCLVSFAVMYVPLKTKDIIEKAIYLAAIEETSCGGGTCVMASWECSNNDRSVIFHNWINLAGIKPSPFSETGELGVGRLPFYQGDICTAP